MFLILAAVLAIAWIIAIPIIHASGLAIHVLLALAAVSVLFHFVFHFVRPRHYVAPAATTPPKDAVKVTADG
jgi:uncharacterized membrane protein